MYGKPVVVRVGQKVGRFTIKRVLRKYGKFHGMVVIKCQCGRTKRMRKYEIFRSDIRRAIGCGCINKTHGGTSYKTSDQGIIRTYRSFNSMLARTVYSGHEERKPGYRDVAVDDRWNPLRGGSFQNFLSDMGIRPEGTSLGRPGDVGDYGPRCSWMSHEQQVTERRKKFETKAATKAA